MEELGLGLGFWAIWWCCLFKDCEEEDDDEFFDGVLVGVLSNVVGVAIVGEERKGVKGGAV